MSEFDFEPYLSAIATHYDQWWRLYTLSDAEGKQAEARGQFFEFGLMVERREEREKAEEGREKVERLDVLAGLRKYAVEHVLLVGRPGSGKSTALARLMLETAVNGRIPVLVELRSWQSSIFELICNSCKRHGLVLSIAQVQALLDDRKFLLLIDGVNELPSEAARTDVGNFRRNHPKVAMIFTTRDLSLGGDLGIEKKLEMQALTEEQMRSFVLAYLPEQAEGMLRQLQGRLREMGQTPLLLWMLCEVFEQAPNQQLPNNLAEVFQIFTRMYEESSVRRHEVAVLKGDVRPLSDRRLWKPALKHLASAMMQGKESTDFRIILDRKEAEKLLLEALPSEKFPIRDLLDGLLKYHLLQNKTPDIIEFRHQMIQEYYIAEWLMKDIFPSKDFDDGTLIYEYLNNRKWTESISSMLGLLSNEDEILRIIRLALVVDLFLGARLADKANPKFHDKTVALVTSLDVPEWLKIRLVTEIKSLAVIPVLTKALESPDFDVHWWAGYAFKDIYFDEAPHELLKLLSSENPVFRKNAAQALGYLGSNSTVALLIDATVDDDPGVRREIVQALGKIGCKKAVPRLIELSYDKDASVREYVVAALGEIAAEESLQVLLDALVDIRSWPTRMKAAKGLGKISSQLAVPRLIKSLEDSENFVRKEAAEALIKISKAFDIAQYLPDLQNLLITGTGKEALRVINEIQVNCKFYNYEIFHSPPAKPQSTQQSTQATTINQYPNVTEVKIFESIQTYHASPPRDPPP